MKKIGILLFVFAIGYWTLNAQPVPPTPSVRSVSVNTNMVIVFPTNQAQFYQTNNIAGTTLANLFTQIQTFGSNIVVNGLSTLNNLLVNGNQTNNGTLKVNGSLTVSNATVAGTVTGGIYTNVSNFYVTNIYMPNTGYFSMPGIMDGGNSSVFQNAFEFSGFGRIISFGNGSFIGNWINQDSFSGGIYSNSTFAGNLTNNGTIWGNGNYVMTGTNAQILMRDSASVPRYYINGLWDSVLGCWKLLSGYYNGSSRLETALLPWGLTNYFGGASWFSINATNATISASQPITIGTNLVVNGTVQGNGSLMTDLNASNISGLGSMALQNSNSVNCTGIFNGTINPTNNVNFANKNATNINSIYLSGQIVNIGGGGLRDFYEITIGAAAFNLANGFLRDINANTIMSWDEEGGQQLLRQWVATNLIHGVNQPYVYSGGSANANGFTNFPTQMSITQDASGLKLAGDSSSPGNNKYYGTDGSGTKGFHSLPSSTNTLPIYASANGAGTSSSYEVERGVVKLKLFKDFSLYSRTVGTNDSEFNWIWLNRSNCTNADENVTYANTFTLNSINEIADWFAGPYTAPFRYKLNNITYQMYSEKQVLTARLACNAENFYNGLGIMIVNDSDNSKYLRIGIGNGAGTSTPKVLTYVSTAATETGLDSFSITNGVWLRLTILKDIFYAEYNTNNVTTPPTSGWSLTATGGHGLTIPATFKVGTILIVNATNSLNGKVMYYDDSGFASDPNRDPANPTWCAQGYSYSSPVIGLVTNYSIGSSTNINLVSLKNSLLDSVNTQIGDSGFWEFSCVLATSNNAPVGSFTNISSFVVSGSGSVFNLWGRCTSTNGTQAGSLKPFTIISN